MMTEYDAVIFTDLPNVNVIWKPIGAYKVAHVLREHGYKVLVVDHFHFFNKDEIADIINHTVSSRTKFVGFSVTFYNSIETSSNLKIQLLPMDFNQSFCPQGLDFEQHLVARIKQANSKCKIVLGGASTVTHLLNNKNVDFVVFGYAEISVVTLMKHLDRGESLNSSFKNVHGITIIDDRNATGYDISSSTMKWLPEDIGVDKLLPLEISRGCVFNCAFCTYPMRGKKSTDFLRDESIIADELIYNYENYGITSYSLDDDTFNDSDEKLDMMLRVRKKLNFTPAFWCYARLDLLTIRPDQIDKMYDIGVRSIYLGVETLNRAAGLKIEIGRAHV